MIPVGSERSHDKLTSTRADGEMTLLGFGDTQAKGMMSSLATTAGDRSKRSIIVVGPGPQTNISTNHMPIK